MRATVTIGAIVLLLLSACGDVGNEGEATPEEQQATPPGGVATTAADPTNGGPVPEPEAQPIDADKARAEETEPATHPDPLVASAIADLAERRAIDAASITFVSIERVTWRNGAMGCPEPGMSYTQALIRGSRILLEVDGVSYWYHSGGVRVPFLCEKPEK